MLTRSSGVVDGVDVCLTTAVLVVALMESVLLGVLNPVVLGRLAAAAVLLFLRLLGMWTSPLSAIGNKQISLTLRDCAVFPLLTFSFTYFPLPCVIY